jgi:hypothetical protein
MATLLHLQQSGAIARFDPETVTEERFIYALPRFQTWVQNELPLLASNWDLENSPVEQFDDLMAQFALGDALAVGDDFRCLFEHDDGVWELKTADLRIFGWFYKRDVFVAASAGAAWKIKEANLYAGFREQTKRDRDQLDLDRPKFLAGSDPNAVVSSFHYP